MNKDLKKANRYIKPKGECVLTLYCNNVLNGRTWNKEVRCTQCEGCPHNRTGLLNKNIIEHKTKIRDQNHMQYVLDTHLNLTWNVDFLPHEDVWCLETVPCGHTYSDAPGLTEFASVWYPAMSKWPDLVLSLMTSNMLNIMFSSSIKRSVSFCPFAGLNGTLNSNWTLYAYLTTWRLTSAPSLWRLRRLVVGPHVMLTNLASHSGTPMHAALYKDELSARTKFSLISSMFSFDELQAPV